ncbi:hypothetical protein AVEN_187277-1 [Araneus ventricosus]|uniref:Uncharacterized protein n=1 Tax=Araneus ventricosus TaxID=182803 RepID=A0A4Y2WAQ6_ARAVE|nr:hypothetical protein AVEN_187277-1 [Araneus ventricosus]
MQKSRGLVVWPKENSINKKVAHKDPAHVPFSGTWLLMKTFRKAGSQETTFRQLHMTFFRIWLIPPVHRWYQGSQPGGCLSIACNRRDQTTLTRFFSGHIRSLTFSDNSKCFEVCPKCTAQQVTPDHILACLELSKHDLGSNPLLTLDFFRVHRLMDLI